MITPILNVQNLHKHYTQKGPWWRQHQLKALRGIDFSLGPGKILGVVGESGCGKSTLAKVLMGIEDKTSGSMNLMGKELEAYPRKDLVHKIQMVFQDPFESLNPRKPAWKLISEPLHLTEKVSAKTCLKRAEETLALVGLPRSLAHRYPHMLSGGQRQRLEIARALILRPKILILDEPVSALDVSVQAQVLNLLLDIKNRFGLTYIFISHDLSVVRYLADEVMVLYLGKVVEHGPAQQVFVSPNHPYTRGLIDSCPRLEDPNFEAPPLSGELPSPLAIPSGCSFRSRCPKAQELCAQEEPLLTTKGKEKVACHFPLGAENGQAF